MDYALSLPDGEGKVHWMGLALNTKNQLSTMKIDTHYDNHEGYEEAQTNYMVFLSQLYKSDVFLKYYLESKK